MSAYRAWAYLQLALLYGEIPFYTQPLLSYSEIEQVMNDPSRRKGLGEICSYFLMICFLTLMCRFPITGTSLMTKIAR